MKKSLVRSLWEITKFILLFSLSFVSSEVHNLPPLPTLFLVPNGYLCFQTLPLPAQVFLAHCHIDLSSNLSLSHTHTHTHTLQRTARKPVMTLHCLESLYSSHL